MSELQRIEGEWIPQYFSLGEAPFLDSNGDPSGAAGSTAVLSKSIANFPIQFTGVRISNVYALPEGAPTDTQLRTYEACKRWVDGEQTVRISLSQQNVTTEAILAVQLVGSSDGSYWAPFPAPYPMAGANDITLELVRVTGYPQIVQGVEVLPRVRASLVTAQFRMGPTTVPPLRRGNYS